MYTPLSLDEIVSAPGPRLLKVQLPNAEEESWTKEIEVDSEEWSAILAQAGISQQVPATWRTLPGVALNEQAA